MVVSSMLATTSPTSSLRSAGAERLGPRADLGVQVVEPVQGDEDHRADQVGAVVHRDVRPVLQGGGDVPVVAALVLALDGVDRDAEVLARGWRRRRPGSRAGSRRRGRGRPRRPRASGPGWRSRPSRAGRPTSACPASGFSASNRSRIARSTGMSRSAHSTRFRPASASDRSLTSPSTGAAATVANSGTPLVVVSGKSLLLPGGYVPTYELLVRRSRSVLRRSQSIQSSGPGSGRGIRAEFNRFDRARP